MRRLVFKVEDRKDVRWRRRVIVARSSRMARGTILDGIDDDEDDDDNVVVG